MDKEEERILIRVSLFSKMIDLTKNNATTWIMLICTTVIGLLGGGYYVSVSALADIFLLGILSYRMYFQKKVKAAWDLNMAAIAVLAFAYLIVSLWAVDSGMAVLGFVKFLPLLLFYVLVSGEPEQREKMISLLPMLGALMTLFSFLMMQFPAYEEWVSVAGRLAGFFQYPNTYALFMLVCLIVVLWGMERKSLDWLDVVYALAAVFGIATSGSRTVFVLTAGALVWILIVRSRLRSAALVRKNGMENGKEHSKEHGKEDDVEGTTGRKKIRTILASGGTVLILAVVLAVLALTGNLEVLERFTRITLSSSTFLGRLLYARDALPLILTHPFGLGYYGYYFIQQSVQTGVYSVANVHNELLQMFLDVGVIPAVLMCAAVLRSLLAKKTAGRNRLVLAVLILHSLFDYDFQFLAMGFVLILFLDMRNVKEYKVPALTGTVTGLAGIGSLALAVLGGMSDLQYTSGNPELALRIYSGNTLAEIQLLTEADTAEEMRERADLLIAGNEYISVAYSARARAKFSEGDVGGFIEDKQKAIELAPYQYEEYTDYLEILAYCEGQYLDSGSMEDAQICADQAEEIPKMLQELQKKTSWLGWRIADRPQVSLSYENMQLIETMQEMAGGQDD